MTIVSLPESESLVGLRGDVGLVVKPFKSFEILKPYGMPTTLSIKASISFFTQKTEKLVRIIMQRKRLMSGLNSPSDK